MSIREINTEITPDNWTFTNYTDGELVAIITFGASSEILDDNFIYYVTLLDQDNNEIFQKEFNTIDAACLYANDKYQKIWDFENKLKPAKAGGCSTCIAH